MPVSHVHTSPVADATGTLTIWNGATTATVAASNLILPSHWNALHAGGIDLGASNTTYTGGTVVLSGGANITVGTNGSTITIAGAAAQTGISGVGNSETTYTSGTVSLSVEGGLLTIRSTTGQAFRFSVSQSVQAETQTFLGALGNSQTTYTSGTVNLSVVGGPLTIRSTTGQAFQFSADPTQTGISGVANSQTTYTSGTVSLSELGAITIRSTTGNQYQFSVNAQTAQTGISGIANSQTTYTSGTVSLSELGAITIRSTTGNQYQFSVAAQTNQSAIRGLGVSNTGTTAGNTGLSSGQDFVIAASGGITASESTGAATNTIWLSVPAGASATGNLGGIAVNALTTYTSGTVVLSAGANITLGTNAQTVTISGVASQTVQTQNMVAVAANALTTYTSGTVVISATGQLQLSTNAQTISLGVPDLAFSTFGNFADITLATTNLTASTRSLFIFPLHPSDGVFPADITASTARLLMSVNATTTATNVAAWTLSMGLAIYRVSGSGSTATLSLLNSASWSFGSNNTAASTAFSNSVSGVRWATLDKSQWSSSPVFTEGGQYYGAFFQSSAGPAIQTWALYGQSVLGSFNIGGAIGAASVSNTTAGFPNYGGVYSATTGAFPASINVNQLNRQAANPFVPYIEFDMLAATH